MRATLLVLAMAATALAGCSDGGGGDGGEGQPPLSAGKGAIAGLLINDVYRPVPGGLILLQPAGLTATSDDSGQFTFTDLEPGAYLLRVQADGHESAPQDVEVKAGEYAESELIARRVFNEAGRILTTEYNVFISCAVDFVANGIVYDCTMDQSGDSDRADFVSNYTAYANATYLVTEMKANNDDRYEVQVRSSSCPSDNEGGYYAVTQFEGTYTKMIMPLGGISEQNAELSYGPNAAWDNACELQTILFSDSIGREELQENGVPVCCGAGAHFGIKAKFVQSLFIGEPEVDIATYSVLG